MTTRPRRPPLHPQIAPILAGFKASGKYNEMTAPQAHALYETRVAALNMPRDPVESVRDFKIPNAPRDIPVRLYSPLGTQAAAVLPLLVFFHGGGFVLGSLETHDPQCRRLANLVPCRVLSVDYGLAPEVRFPQAHEEAWAAMTWAASNAAALGCDPARLAVGGDSAGGTLATMVTQMARDRGGPALQAQMLIYPSTDPFFRLNLPSHAMLEEELFLTRTLKAWYIEQYLPKNADREDPRLSPGLNPDLSGLPPAFIAGAELDPICDEGQLYADRLRAEGISVDSICCAGMIHGFLVWGGAVDAAAHVLELAAYSLRRYLHVT